MTVGVQDNLDVARMTEIYSMVRQPMGNFVLDNSRKQGFRYELNVAELEDIQENEPVQIDRLFILTEQIIRAWKWSWTTSVLDDQRRAIALL
jgi:salicylate hydroxylase